MAGFAESFWGDDYASTLTKLFAKLGQGIIENEEVIALARRRAEAEEAHGNKLQQIARDAYRKDGFVKDDGASLRRAFEGMTKETSESGKHHLKIAANLQNMVLKPFGRWTIEHASRVQTSEKELLGKVKLHDKQFHDVKKLRSTYFNKCRLLEDYEEENKLAFPGPNGSGTPTKPPKKTAEEIAADLNAVLDDEPIELGETIYSSAQMKVLLENILDGVLIKEVRIPILGTFQHVSTGSAIVEWLHKNMGVASLGAAEAIGQDLLNNGFIRYLGVGSTFANSSVLNYQWRDKALIAAGKMKSGTNGIASRAAAMPYVGDYVSSYVSNEHANETAQERLTREATQSNEAYKTGVRKLDELRTDMEATIMEHLRFMERCELDRLKALKAVMMDISAAISNVIPAMKSSMDTMLLFQESISPLGDLKYMIESYRSGNFSPRVVTYENYYNSVDEQTFGVDLELRARQDKKRVPNIVATVLSHMDELYPDLANDEARQRVWLRQVPLHLTHQLRAAINTGRPIERKVLADFDPAVVAAVLKLYLMELPDSVISTSLYEPTKSIYSNYNAEDDIEDRITALSNVLSQLRVSNIATLDALTIHFSRLLELTSADADYKTSLAMSLAPCLIRPRQESSLTQQDKHPVRLFQDLLQFRREIFTTLKRASTTRARSSTDERDRRLRVEERNRAISAAGRRPSSSGSSVNSVSLNQVSIPPSSLRNETTELSSKPAREPLNSTITRRKQDPEVDQPFDPESEIDSEFNPDDLPEVDNRVGHVETTETSMQSRSEAHQPSKKLSLTRSIAPAHRTSRPLGRPESRSLTDSAEAVGVFDQRHSVELYDNPVIRQSVTLTDNPVPAVHGISLEDGNADYD